MAVLFDATGERLHRETGGFLTPAADFTIMLYVRPLTGLPTLGQYRTFYQLDDDPAFAAYVGFYQGGDGAFQLYAANGTVPDQWIDVAGSFGTDVHLCCTYVAATHQFTYYVQGVSAGTFMLDMSLAIFTSEKVSDAGTWSAFQGVCLRTWQRALSAAEVAAQRLNLAFTTGTGLFMNLPLGADALDVSGHGRHATATAGVTFPPTNTSAVLATPLTLPAAITQNVHNAGTTYAVWHSVVAPATGEVSVWGHGGYGASLYKARVDIWLGPASAPVLLYDGMLTADNGPMHFPVDVGVQYFIRSRSITTNPTPAVLTLGVSLQAPTVSDAGSIVVPDDTPLLPLGLLRADANVTVQRYVRTPTPGFPSGEAGDVLPNGTCLICWSTIASGSPYGVDLYDHTFAHVAAALRGFKVDSVSSNHANAFYVLVRPPVGDPLYLSNLVKKISATGVVDPRNWDLGKGPAVNIQAIAVNPAETILYYMPLGGNIKRWNLVTNAAMSDLVVRAFLSDDLLCLGDGSVVACAGAGGTNTVVLHYSPAGALLTSTVVRAPSQMRLARGVDDVTSVWAWNKGETPCIFTQVRMSDGAVITTTRHGLYNSGIWWDANGPPSVAAVEGALFGASESCPFWIARTPFPAPVATGSIRVSKVSDVPGDTTSFFFHATGLTPATFVLRGGESFVFEDVPVGTIYTLHEQPLPGWKSEAVVSAGTLDGIIVTANAETTVTFTNTPTRFGPGFVTTEHIIRRVRQAPHLSAENVRLQYHEFHLDCHVGIGLPIAEGLGRDPVIVLDWSDDNQSTWSHGYPRPLWRLGAYLDEVIWRRLGQSRDRIFRVIVSEPVDVALVDAYVSLSKGLS